MPAFASAAVEMVVDEAGGLEERVADGGAEEAESAAAHVAADGVGQWRSHRHCAGVGHVVDNSFASRQKASDILVKGTEFLHYFAEEPCVDDGAVYLAPVSDDGVAMGQTLLVVRRHFSHTSVVEIMERTAVALALAQYCYP